MPVRFRCCYCSQLLGISRRKVGTVVECPNCLGQVWVPDPNQPAEDNPLSPLYPGQQAYAGPAPVAPPEPAAALVLTPARLGLMALVLLLGLILFFGLGVWIGRALKRPRPPASETTVLPDLTPRFAHAQDLAGISRMHGSAPSC